MKLTNILILASLAVVLTTAPLPAASPESAAMATVQQFITGFNRSDTKSMLAACAGQASVIDDFPPHEWQGPAACADWAAGYAAEAKKDGITDGVVTLSNPWYQSVTGDRAYLVVPATFSYKLNGKPVTERNAVFTVSLRKFASGWRITGWAWSKH